LNKTIIFHIQNLRLNTTNLDLNLNVFNPKYNPFYRIILPFTFITSSKITHHNLILFQFPKLDLNGNIILNGLKKTYISRLKRTEGFYFTTTTIRGNLVYRVFILFNSLTNKDIMLFSRYGFSLSLKQILKQTYDNYISIISKPSFNLDTLISLVDIFDLNNNCCSFNTNITSLYKIKTPFTNLFKQKLDNLFGYDVRNQMTFLSKDLINLLDLLFDFKFNTKSVPIIDNFCNKKLESITDIIINQTHLIVEKRLQGLINHIKTNNEDSISLLNNKKLIPNFKEVFTINPLIQYLDQINTLSEFMHKMKLTKTNLQHIKDVKIRDIKRSEVGKICLIDTTEGDSSGLIVYLPHNIIQNKNGFLETPYKLNSHEIENTRIKTLDSISQEHTTLQFTKPSKRKNLHFNTLNSVTFVKNFLELESVKNLSCQFIPESSFFSLAENFIPFFFYNDPTRSLMGSKMQMQSVPLIYKQNVNILTGKEQLLNRKNSNLIYALQEGVVTYTSSYKINIRDIYNREVSYYLNNYKFSNQNTLHNSTPLVWVGERVTTGQLLAINQDFEGNEFSIGNNLLVLYGSFIGYDFEDALILNKTVVKNNIFSSLHMDIYDIPFEVSSYQAPEFTSIKIPKYSQYVKRNLNSFGIIKEGSKILEKDLILAKCTLNELGYTKESLKHFLFTLFGSKLRNIKDTSTCLSLGNGGRVVKIESITDKKMLNNNHYLKLRFFIIKQRLLEVGDKL
ncbi:Rna polymerase B, partial [Cardiosporidium cionae]